MNIEETKVEEHEVEPPMKVGGPFGCIGVVLAILLTVSALVGIGLSQDITVGGTITDVIVERRLDAIIERIEAKQSEAFEAMARRNDGPFAELRNEVKNAVSTILQDRAAIADLRRETAGIFPRLNEFLDNSKEFIAEWKPIRDGVDAINELIWKLFIMGILILVGIGILKYVAVKILGLILPKWLMPIALVAVSPSFAFSQIRCEQMQGPNPVYRIHRPNYSNGCGSTGHSARPPSFYHAPIVQQPIRTIAAPVYRVVEPVVAPVVNTVRSVSGCANGQCEKPKTYTSRLLQPK